MLRHSVSRLTPLSRNLLTSHSLISTSCRCFHSSSISRSQSDVSPNIPDTGGNSPRVQKLVAEYLALNVVESIEFIEQLKKKLGYVDAPVVMQAGPATGAPAAAAPAAAAPKKEAAAPASDKPVSYAIKLEKFDAKDKIKVIKEVRVITGLGLKESKELVESAPKLLKKDIKKEDADAMMAKLKEAGAVCTMEEIK